MLGMLTGMAQAAVVNNTDQNQAKVVKELVKSKKYVVQLGAFVDEFQALHRRQQWTEAGIKTYVLPASGDSGAIVISGV